MPYPPAIESGVRGAHAAAPSAGRPPGALARSAQAERPDFAVWWRGTSPFDTCANVVLAASSDFETVTEFDVPHGSSGLLEYWGGQGEDVTAGASIQWQVVVDGQPLPHASYDRCGDWIGLEQNRLCELRVFLTQGARVELRAKNHHGSNGYSVCGRLKGTLWPARPEELA